VLWRGRASLLCLHLNPVLREWPNSYRVVISHTRAGLKEVMTAVG